jgi:hypothetical protein
MLTDLGKMEELSSVDSMLALDAGILISVEQLS